MPEFDFGFEKAIEEDLVATVPLKQEPIARTGGSVPKAMYAGVAAVVVAASVALELGGCAGLGDILRARAARPHVSARSPVARSSSGVATAARRVHAKRFIPPQAVEVLPSFSEGDMATEDDDRIPNGLYDVLPS